MLDGTITIEFGKISKCLGDMNKNINAIYIKTIENKHAILALEKMFISGRLKAVKFVLSCIICPKVAINMIAKEHDELNKTVIEALEKKKEAEKAEAEKEKIKLQILK